MVAPTKMLFKLFFVENCFSYKLGLNVFFRKNQFSRYLQKKNYFRYLWPGTIIDLDVTDDEEPRHIICNPNTRIQPRINYFLYSRFLFIFQGLLSLLETSVTIRRMHTSIYMKLKL